MTKADRVITTTLLINLLLFLQLVQFANAQNYGPEPPSANSFSSKQKFNPSFAVIMVILVGAFFLLGFFSVYIRQCVAGGGGFSPAHMDGDGRRSWLAPRGLDPAVIETFPTFAYSYVKGLKIGKDSLECAVCLNEFEDDETLRLLPKCNHVFHPDCVDAWLSSHTTCPVCRADLEPKPGEILVAPILIFDPESEPDEPHATPGSNETTAEVCDANSPIRPSSKVQSPDVSFQIPNQNPPPRTRSTGFRVAEIFSRSHTTGHSLVQVGENLDRFTLRLPEEVRSQLLNSSLNRAKSCVAFPRVRSTKKGFRSGSNRSGRRGFSMTPPFFSRTGSIRSPSNMVGGSTGEEVIIGTQRNLSLFKSVKSPFDRLFLGADRENTNVNNNVVGERSFDRLKLDSQV